MILKGQRIPSDSLDSARSKCSVGGADDDRELRNRLLVLLAKCAILAFWAHPVKAKPPSAVSTPASGSGNLGIDFLLLYCSKQILSLNFLAVFCGKHRAIFAIAKMVLNSIILKVLVASRELHRLIFCPHNITWYILLYYVIKRQSCAAVQ